MSTTAPAPAAPKAMTQTLITLDEAIAHLRLDMATDNSDPRQPDLELKLDQAVAIVFDYIKAETIPSDPATVDGQVLAACYVILTGLWDGRDPGDPLLTVDVAAILARSRDPAFA